MPPNTVKVCRPGKWGNPYRIGVDGDAETCVRTYKQAIKMGAGPDEIEELRGKNLACWCALDAPCHADVLLRLANVTAHPPLGAGASVDSGVDVETTINDCEQSGS